jgi:uncharacterized spore protein YtfJ
MTTSGIVAGGSHAAEQTREQTGGVIATEAPERTLNDALRRMIESVRPEAIFGAPIEREGVTIIPCAEVMTGFGMGGGTGYGPASMPTASAATPASVPTGGGGIGGGGGAQGRPVAVVVIAQGRARVLPVVDATKFLIAGLTTLGFVTFWLSQTFARSQTGRRKTFSSARFSRAMRAARGRAF